MVLENDVLKLRPFEIEDIDQILPHFNDEEVRQYLAVIFPVNKLVERNFIESLYKDDKNILLGMEVNGTLIGSIGLHRIDWVNRSTELGIVIFRKEYWNKGYGTKAIDLMLKYAFKYLNMNRVSLKVYEYNERAIHVYEKCGFKVEGRLRKAKFFKGRYWDVLVMGILRDEYFESRRKS
ncbi:MAG: GNAT family N-acetyltransferase [Thermotogae bacterium]|nr:GNAT family N-acetyltransferase [Thermotogota bacterium]RKX54331.1 MAG: N-acetyltransferase [Thermotoga sp.]HDM70437.1 N-acetyltransferase [Thermotogales bacterium]